MYILVAKEPHYTDVYAGKTYIFQGGHYPYIAETKEQYKKYKTLAIAQNACDKLNAKTGRLFVAEKFEV